MSGKKSNTLNGAQQFQLTTALNTLVASDQKHTLEDFRAAAEQELGFTVTEANVRHCCKNLGKTATDIFLKQDKTSLSDQVAELKKQVAELQLRLKKYEGTDEGSAGV